MYMQMAVWAARVSLEAAALSAQAGKKLIEVAIPAVKKASKISLTFVQGGVNAVRNQSSQFEQYKLSERLDIIDNGLSIPLSFSENQFKTFNQEVKDELNIIRGQNEIMFLSNSVSYFVESHATRTGLDRAISHALQYDIMAVRNHLNKSRDLRFPGYLLHQCTCLGETVKELNIFYTSILLNGKVPHFTEDAVEEELTKCYGVSQRKGSVTSYYPYELQLPILRRHTDEKQKNVSILTKWLGEDKDFKIAEIKDKVHEALFILNEELIANEELEEKIYKKLKDIPEKRLFVESYSEKSTVPNGQEA